MAANGESTIADGRDSNWAERGEDDGFLTIFDPLVPGVFDSDSLGSSPESTESDTGETMLGSSPTLAEWDWSGSEPDRPLDQSDDTGARSNFSDHSSETEHFDYSVISNAGLGHDVSPELLLPQPVENNQWHAMLTDQSDSDSFSTDVHSHFSDHSSSTNLYAGVGFDIPPNQLQPQPRSEAPNLSLSTTAPQHGAEIPCSKAARPQWQRSNPTSEHTVPPEAASARPSKPARVADRVPAKSPPLDAPVAKPKHAGADAAQALCPLCNHRCQEQHRLGKYWRKFGYRGPPYCTRCSGVFRAHILTCSVQPGTCSRASPCSTCTAVLSHFDRPKQELFDHMDVSQPRSRCTYAKSGHAAENTGLQCPLCSQTAHNGLGAFWKKFGYAGPAYCTLCSSSFRNHIIRQRQTRSSCSRETPCERCSKILSHFPEDPATTYAAIDAATASSNAHPGRPHIKNESAQDGKTGHLAASVPENGPKRSVDGLELDLSSGAQQDSPTKKRRKKRRPSAVACLAAMAVFAINLMINGFWPREVSIVTSPSSDQLSQNNSAPSTPQGRCNGGELQPHMNKGDLDSCVGEQGDVCYDVGCDPGFTLAGEMKCDQGEFRGASCVWDAAPDLHCIGVAPDYNGQWLMEGRDTHIDQTSLRACRGPVGSTCTFQCDAGYVPYGNMVCSERTMAKSVGNRRILGGLLRSFMPPPDRTASDVSVVTGKAPSTFAGGVCRADPAMVDAAIASILVNASSQKSDLETAMIAGAWYSELQIARSQSCSQLASGQCWCSLGGVAHVDGCMDALVCQLNGWQCQSELDPQTRSKLKRMLDEHATATLIQWAEVVGFARHFFERGSAETSSAYKQRMVELLVEPLNFGNFDEHGRLIPEDIKSAVYVHDHGCPANTFSTAIGTPIPPMTCEQCPSGKESAAGAMQQSDCKAKPTHQEPERPLEATTGTPFPDCYGTGECDLVSLDLSSPMNSESLAVLAKPPSTLPHAEHNRTNSASPSSTWQVFIPALKHSREQ